MQLQTNDRDGGKRVSFEAKNCILKYPIVCVVMGYCFLSMLSIFLMDLFVSCNRLQHLWPFIINAQYKHWSPFFSITIGWPVSFSQLLCSHVMLHIQMHSELVYYCQALLFDKPMAITNLCLNLCLPLRFGWYFSLIWRLILVIKGTHLQSVLLSRKWGLTGLPVCLWCQWSTKSSLI